MAKRTDRNEHDERQRNSHGTQGRSYAARASSSGTWVSSNGAQASSSGTWVSPNGAQASSSGTWVSSNGAQASSSGTWVSPNGAKASRSGAKLYSNQAQASRSATRVHSGPQASSSATQVSDQAQCASLFYLYAEDICVYRYDVEITRYWSNRKDQQKETRNLLTRAGVDIGRRILHRRLCEAIMRAVCRNHQFGIQSGAKRANPRPYVYDGKKNLYLLQTTGYNEKVMEIGTNEVPRDLAIFIPYGVSVKIMKSATFELKLNDFTSSLKEGNDLDHDLSSFFELLTTQSLYEKDGYDIVNNGTIFYRNGNNGNREVYLQTELREGFKKAIRFIRGPENPNCDGGPALVLDALSSVFYPSMTMYDLIRMEAQKAGHNNLANMHPKDLQQILDPISALYKGVRGYLTHDPRRTRVFEGFTDQTMNDLRLKTDKKMINFVDFHRSKTDGRKLQTPSLPAVVCDVRDDMYPPDVFHILPYQRIPTSNMNQTISRRLITENAIKPHERRDRINAAIAHINQAFLAQFGVRIDTNMISDKGLICDLIQPVYNMDGSLPPRRNRKGWEYVLDKRCFDKPAELTKGVLVLCKDLNRYQTELRRLLGVGKERGMRFRETFVELGRNFRADDDLESYINKYKKDHEFVILCDDDRANSHHLLKRLEVGHGIMTQQIRKRTLDAPRRQTDRDNRLESYLNFMLKMNIKCGGFNYVPNLDFADKYESGLFVFAYDVAHPAPATGVHKNKIFAKAKTEQDKEEARKITSLEPSVVGYAANMAENPFNFIGNYAFQQSRKESIGEGCLTRCVNYCLNKLKENRPTFTPKQVIIIRDGVSEGDYSHTAMAELEIIRPLVNGFFKDQNIVFDFVIVNKRHSKRFFSGQSDAALYPPRIVRSIVVRPNFKEFYLMPHYPVQGTAKLPQFSVVQKESKMPYNFMEIFLHWLCNCHQVFLGGVSLPEPVFLAHELAKRGRHNYLQYAREPGAMQRDQLVDDNAFSALTNILSYNNVPALNNMRFTA